MATLLVAIDPPETCPTGLLAVVTSLWTTKLIIILNARSSLDLYDIPRVLEVFAAIFAFKIILGMPFRSPKLPNDQISPPFGHPTHQLRSPEDNMTLW